MIDSSLRAKLLPFLNTNWFWGAYNVGPTNFVFFFNQQHGAVLPENIHKPSLSGKYLLHHGTTLGVILCCIIDFALVQFCALYLFVSLY